ncbi:hypothetical protein, partial [Helicobacter pullorum]
SGEGFYFSTPNHYRIKFSDSNNPKFSDSNNPRVTIITQEIQMSNGIPRNCAFSCNLTQEEKAFLIKFINEDTKENFLEVKEGKLYYSYKENLE